MGNPPRSIEMPVQHLEHVYLVAQGDPPAGGIEEVSTSWQRSATEYGVDPDSSEAPRILMSDELKQLREPLDQLIFSAQEEIDRLYKVVREAGYTLLFCDTAGVAVEHRGDEADASRFKYWGTWLGGVWPETIEGTNGIGTCIAEERPVTVHRNQHFRSRHVDLSCSAAPIFDVDGSLMAVLDVSAIDPERSQRAHALTGALTVNSARAIEERFFRERFRREWVIAVAPPEEGATGMLLAVDNNQRIVGANRAARTSLLLDDHRLRIGVSLWIIFERDPGLFRRKDTADIPTQLIVAGSDETWPALVTSPESGRAAWQQAQSDALHTRPRLDSLSTLRQRVSPPPARGGLPPGAMRRVREHVEVHLSESMDLAELAAIAGLSLFHFARAFKQSAGVTPHHYLVRRRIERAQEMLARSELPLSEIALATGFSDQSHLARHFRQMLGMTPGQFRWSQR
ncbi:MAG TPA: helix-turn-helix domain-containing protein [Stellaceae bacterium]|nr:helix-turn-helix domain-containing protein [Stellaceae bacterium]